MKIQKIITEELASIILESITKNFAKAIEAYKKIQFKQQDLRKAFVSEKDPKKKEKLKQGLIKLHKQVQRAEQEFNAALRTEPIEDVYEGKLNESPIDEFTKELNDEKIKAKIYTATGDGRTIEAQFTNKKWDDGVPVTKYLTRGGYKSIKTPKGKFKVIETNKFWYYEIKRGWAAVSTKKYGTPPFEY
jgi:transcriptional regulator of acetoin/glycerol metabolism